MTGSRDATQPAPRACSRRGFTMVEVVLATATVGVMTVGALSVAVSAAKERTVSASRARATNLAQSMLDEVLSVPASAGSVSNDGDGTPVAPTRAAFDELADYDGWTATPPKDRAGTSVPGADAYTRAVAVTEVSGANPAGPGVAGTGVFRVEVTVLRGGIEVMTMTAVRTAAYDEADS